MPRCATSRHENGAAATEQGRQGVAAWPRTASASRRRLELNAGQQARVRRRPWPRSSSARPRAPPPRRRRRGRHCSAAAVEPGWWRQQPRRRNAAAMQGRCASAWPSASTSSSPRSAPRWTTTQQAQWDREIAALLGSRRAPLYKLVDGKPKAVMVRVGRQRRHRHRSRRRHPRRRQHHRRQRTSAQ